MYYLREKLSGIYSYRDLKQGYKIVYIGQSRDIYHRHRNHCRDAKYNQPIDKVILSDPKRYVLYIEELCDECELNTLEALYIKQYNPMYNCTRGGDYTHAHHHSGAKKYDKFWDTKKLHYISHENQKRNRPFRLYYKGFYVPCGYFEDWVAGECVWELINQEVEDEIKQKCSK